jgi:hypothetical protein
VFRQNELESDGRSGKWRVVFVRGAFQRAHMLPASYLVSSCAAFNQFLLSLDAAGGDDDELTVVLRVEQDVINAALARKDPRASASIFVVACRGTTPAFALSAEAMRAEHNAASSKCSSDTSFVVNIKVRAAEGPWVVIPTFFEELHAESRGYTLGAWATVPLRLAAL